MMYHNLVLGSIFVWNQSDYRNPYDVKRIVKSKHYMYETSPDKLFAVFSHMCTILDNHLWNLTWSLDIISTESEVVGLFGDRQQILWNARGKIVVLHIPCYFHTGVTHVPVKNTGAVFIWSIIPQIVRLDAWVHPYSVMLKESYQYLSDLFCWSWGPSVGLLTFLLFIFRVAFTLHSHSEFWRANFSNFVVFLPGLCDEANFSSSCGWGKKKS